MTPFDIELHRHYIESHLIDWWPGYDVHLRVPDDMGAFNGMFSIAIWPRAGGPYYPIPAPDPWRHPYDLPRADGLVWLHVDHEGGPAIRYRVGADEADAAWPPIIAGWPITTANQEG